MQRFISARVEGVHHRCALAPFVWEVHRDEGCKVHTVQIFNVSAKVMSQLSEVINQASHRTSSLCID